jgi:nucleotide-binding universal stress UspA family protein
MPEEGPMVFRTIVYATDFSAEAARAAAFALSFAEDSAAHLYCCSVLSLDEESGRSRAELHQAFGKRLKAMIPESSYDWCTPECVVEYGEAATSILALAARVNADLIVLGARKSSFWLTRVEGGLTPALLAEARCPVLTIC